MSILSLPLVYHGCLAEHIGRVDDVFFCVFWYASPQNWKGNQHHERTDVFPGTAA